MKSLVLVFIAFAFIGCSNDSFVGEQPSDDVTLYTVSEAVQPAMYGKTIRVQGTVKAICQMEGCWMSITDGEEYVRMTFKNSSFVVPMDLDGEVIVEGVVSEEVMDTETVKAIGETIGFTPEEVEMVDGDRRLPMMVATGVEYINE